MLFNRLVFLTACVGMLLFGASLTTLGSSAPFLQERFHMDAAGFGALFSILPFGIVVGSLIFGPIVDRYGYKIIMVLACFFMFAGFQGIAFASSGFLLKGCVLSFGVGGGVINGASNAVVSDVSASNKGANLSLLGVFFAVGALGMPLILAGLGSSFPFETIIYSSGYLAIAAAILIAVVKFPPPKQSESLTATTIKQLFQDGWLMMIGFFLLCQSSFEGVINNWTATYLINRSIEPYRALLAVSLYVTGMALTRLVLGGLLRRISARVVLLWSIGLLFVGCLLLHSAGSYSLSLAALVVIGIGLAAGFPVMLGFVGDRYGAVSGSAFSIVISMALLGNMMITYITGLFVQQAGLQYLMAFTFILACFMLLLTLQILKKQKI